MERLFRDGRELIRLIEEQNWMLYDTTHLANRELDEILDELEYNDPAEEIIKGNNYLLVPLPDENQTIKDAYSLNKEIGPALMLEEPHHPRFEIVHTYEKVISGDFGEITLPGSVALVSKLFFVKNYMVTTNSIAHDPLESDVIAVKQTAALQTFREHFRVLSLEEYGIGEYSLKRNDC